MRPPPSCPLTFWKETDSIALQIRPFKGVYTGVYSASALFCQLLDLPAAERHDIRRIHLAACIPGPKEPDVDELPIFFEPFVSELAALARGIKIPTRRFPEGACRSSLASLLPIR